MKRSFGLLAAIALIAGSFSASFAADGPTHVGTLGADEHVFWDGGSVTYDPTWSAPAAPSNNRAARCDIAPDAPCFRYTLTTTEPGARLRVGLDTPMRDDTFEMIVTDPFGQTTREVNSNKYSMELFVFGALAGDYQITVAPVSAEYASFRMRAKLESTVPALSGTGDALPNLQVTRLWEFGFAAPANPLNGLFPPDDLNPPLSVGGYQPVSCAVDEQLGYDGPPAKRCLRYSFGLANVGVGNFDVRFTGQFMGDPAPMVQCIQQRDGSSPRARAAGTGSFHMTHGHFHYDDIIHHTVYRVTDRTTGAMTEVGTGRKIGYSPADQGMPHWGLFNQSPADVSSSAGDCSGGSSTRVGMSPGWGDAYRYQRPGNFVDFDQGGDGYYVVQTTADPLGVVEESDESDNTSYAFIRVIGEQVDIIESGLGTDPWHSTATFDQ